jgi:hypothetical protein
MTLLLSPAGFGPLAAYEHTSCLQLRRAQASVSDLLQMRVELI